LSPPKELCNYCLHKLSITNCQIIFPAQKFHSAAPQPSASPVVQCNLFKTSCGICCLAFCCRWYWWCTGGAVGGGGVSVARLPETTCLQCHQHLHFSPLVSMFSGECCHRTSESTPKFIHREKILIVLA